MWCSTPPPPPGFCNVWIESVMHLTNSCTGDGKCVICDSYVRPCTLVRICDECNYGSYQGRCVICGGPGVSDAYYCKECTVQEKDVSAFFFLFKQLCSSGLCSISTWWSLVPVVQKLDNAIHSIMQLFSLTLIHWIVIYLLIKLSDF